MTDKVALKMRAEEKREEKKKETRLEQKRRKVKPFSGCKFLSEKQPGYVTIRWVARRDDVKEKREENSLTEKRREESQRDKRRVEKRGVR